MGRIKDSIKRVIRWLREAPIEIEMRAPRFGHPCLLPPIGWYCTRGAGHKGPCAAYENSMFDEAAPITEADWRDLSPLPTVAAQLPAASALASRARIRIVAGSRMLPPEGACVAERTQAHARASDRESCSRRRRWVCARAAAAQALDRAEGTRTECPDAASVKNNRWRSL